MPELLRHLRDGFPVQDVIAIMLGDRLLDCLLAGGVRLVGGAVKLQMCIRDSTQTLLRFPQALRRVYRRPSVR